MDAQKQAQIQHHLDEIAALLYTEADPAKLTTLEGIEKEVRGLAQEYVLPPLGIFLSTEAQAPQVGNSEP